MKRVIVRYKVKQDKVDENIAYINDVFASLKELAPENFRYASFRLEDGVSFVHIASMESDDDANPLPSLDAFKAFVANIADRCDEPPVASVADLIDAYAVF